MFEIVYLLLEKQQVTARQLAQHFEVSIRTIYRDIDKLAMSGVPVYTNKGKGGGICLMENYTLSKSMLSEAEQGEILASLQSLSAVTMAENNQTLQKLSALFKHDLTNWIEIDFSDWSGERKDQFQHLKEAILNRQIVEFLYHNTTGQTAKRLVKPLQLWFKHGAWYLRAICIHKGEMRTFKMNRMKQLVVTSQHYEPVEFETVSEKTDESLYPKVYETTRVMITPEMSFRVYDEFEEDQIDKQPDGSFIITMKCPIDQWLYGYFMSFGEYLRVLSPEAVKQQFKEKIVAIAKQYL